LEYSFDSRASYTNKEVALINPFECSLLNQSNVDEGIIKIELIMWNFIEKVKDIVFSEIKLCRIDKARFDPNERSVWINSKNMTMNEREYQE